VIPIMARGIGEGSDPALESAISQILHPGRKAICSFAQVLPPVMLGSLTAILPAGYAQLYRQEISASHRRRGRLQPGENEELES